MVQNWLNVRTCRSLVFALCLILPLILSPIVTNAAPPTPFPTDSRTIELKTIASGLSIPVAITNANDASNRLFIVEKTGKIRIIQNGKLLDQAFIDLGSVIDSSPNERGLLGLAFHPNYKQNGLFFVHYTAKDGALTIARYHVTSDPNVADPASGKIILQQAHPRVNHNGGQIAFGPDGFLYDGMGDGGGAEDPDRNGQNPKTVLGKILRIDVDTEDPYGVPADNPYAQNGEGRPEVWAIGLRNPWRFSFDRKTGDLYIADVGQDTFEEVDFQKAGTKGGVNYGWSKMEGNHCLRGGAYTGQEDCDKTPYQLPIFEYSHNKGCSISGGYVYRGATYLKLDGTYFFSDYCSGTLWGLTPSGETGSNGQWKISEFIPSVGSISTFGEDESGELYLADGGKGIVYQITLKGS